MNNLKLKEMQTKAYKKPIPSYLSCIGEGSKHRLLLVFEPRTIEFKRILEGRDFGLGRPNEAVFRPNEAVFRPNEAVFRPNEAVFRPNEAVFRPNEAVFRPNEAVFRPNEAVLRPKKGKTSSGACVVDGKL
ncbi:LPXTG-domain-containing protein cell wall anchor domain [Elysia marginata]|uniref:LPXTG-domain-containing protein cell wall anchor domain n=1 Tax=Elysia marginata TaxID=1093978 RepID=A0AAV4H4D6_9GAST|nr:LPXTG-domain-containing protein cell wall anchor domain [Elysia marginata]